MGDMARTHGNVYKSAAIGIVLCILFPYLVLQLFTFDFPLLMQKGLLSS